MLGCFWRDEDNGQEIIEYAMVLPLLLLLLFGIVEFGVAVWHYDTIANAAREAARCGIIPANRVDGMEECKRQAVAHWGIGLNLTTDDFHPTWDDNVVRVEVDYDYRPITGLIIPAATIPFRTVATMRTE